MGGMLGFIIGLCVGAIGGIIIGMVISDNWWRENAVKKVHLIERAQEIEKEKKKNGRQQDFQL